jgi:site-specific DNA-methyltransferase (adenine-specific)
MTKENQDKESSPYGVVSNGGLNLYNGECLEVMDFLISQNIVVDAIITDPPYGTTACKWDSVIPFEAMWERLNKIIKPNGAIVLFGSEPFSSALRMSNIKHYKYDWIWNKPRGSGFQIIKYKPLNSFENICIFAKSGTVSTYNPQMRERDKPRVSKNNGSTRQMLVSNGRSYQGQEALTKKYPITSLFFSNENNKEKKHPTQKPLALMEYLIKTYTHEGETVLDFTMGSGTTAIACLNTKRNFIGIEKDDHYFQVGSERAAKHLETLNSAEGET